MLALTVTLVLLASGCAGPDTAAPAGPTTTGGAGTPVARPATAADLRSGLLEAHDVSTGFVPVTDYADQDGGRADFGGPGCEGLARWLNAEGPRGSRAEAAVALSNGSEGGAAAEQLYAMSSAQAAADAVEDHRRAARRCAQITLSTRGAGTSTFSVHPFSVAGMGDASFATGLSAAGSGSSAEQDIIQVAAHADAVVIAVTFIGADPVDAEAVTRAAVHKVQRELTA